MDKPFAITLDPGSSLANHTGSWRTTRPVYVDRLPPCNHACPAGENIQAWLFHAESGDYETAWRELVKNNPLPAIMGRVCYHPCETACNRGSLDESVSIHAVERFLGDEATKRNWQVEAGAAGRAPVRVPSGRGAGLRASTSGAGGPRQLRPTSRGRRWFAGECLWVALRESWHPDVPHCRRRPCRRPVR